MAIVPLRSEKLLVATALSTGVALLCAMTHASAQQTADDGSSTLLDTIVVPAGKRARLGAEDARALREADFRASSSVRTVTREEIKQIGPGRPDNILQTVPGVFTQGQARMPGVSVNVRGMQDFGRTNVSIDGARQTFQYTTAGPMGMAFIDPALVRGVYIA